MKGTPETTATLLSRARQGDFPAREALIKRYLPALKRLAHGRLPAYARGLIDTDDLVQNTVVRTLHHLDTFEPRREGAFLAYLRQILLNQIRDEIRRVARRPGQEALTEDLRDAARSPLEETIGRETLESYETSLSGLTDDQREAVMLRLEMGFEYQEIADALGSPSANAARMLVARGLLRLAERMRGGIADE